MAWSRLHVYYAAQLILQNQATRQQAFMPERKKRQVFEKGHKRKFMVIVDGTPEGEIALYFAARIANRTNGSLTLFYPIEQNTIRRWVGINDAQNEMEETRAQSVFRLFRKKLKEMGFEGMGTETVVRKGDPAVEIVRYIEQDEDIAVLVLGASADSDGPGPLVEALGAGSWAGNFPIPIYIVPGTLTLDEIAHLA